MKRRLLSVLLALVLIICMAVPALAASRTFSGNWGGATYWLTINRSTSSASAKFEYGATAQVTVYGTALVSLLPNDEHAYGNRTSATGATVATTYMDNYGYSETYQTWMQGEILMVATTSYVGSNYVLSQSY